MKKMLSTVKGKMILGVAAVLLVLAIVIVTVVLLAPKDYRSIKVKNLTGEILITNEGEGEKNAYEGMNLKSGDSVSVEEKSNMVLLLDSDKYVYADEGTRFSVIAGGSEGKSTTKTRIVLEEGSVLCRLDDKLADKESFEVKTPNSVMSVRGTIFKMSVYQDENGEKYVKLDVLEGIVKVDIYDENGEKTKDEGTVSEGHSATILSNSDFSRFVLDENGISYNDYSETMTEFIVEIMDGGRELSIGEDELIHYVSGHKEEKRETKEASCTEEGSLEIYCPSCDKVIATESIEAMGHKEGEWEVKTEGNCKEKGVEVMLCTRCGEELKERETAYGEHSFGKWEETKESTCTQKGEEARTCSICGEKEIRETEAKGHSFGNWFETLAPGCETTGTDMRICQNCGVRETRTLAALGHNSPAHSNEYVHQAGAIIGMGDDGAVSVGNKVTLYLNKRCLRCSLPMEEEAEPITGTITAISGQTIYFKCDICGYQGSMETTGMD